MTTPDDIKRDKSRAGEYVLGLLSPDDASAFEARMTRAPHLRDLVAEWAEGMVQLTNDIDPIAPPTSLKTQIDAALFGEQAQPSFWANVSVWKWISAGTAAAAIAMAVMLSQQPKTTDPTGNLMVAELQSEDESLHILAAYNPDTGTLRLNRLAGQAAENRSLQLWIATDGAPTSLGVLPDTPTAVIQISAEQHTLFEGAHIAVSDEPLGGSPTGQPTGTVLAVRDINSL